MCTSFAFIPLIYYFYPETTNLTLEEIDYLFTKDERAGADSSLLARGTTAVQVSLKAKADIEKGGRSHSLHSVEHVEARDEKEVR